MIKDGGNYKTQHFLLYCSPSECIRECKVYRVTKGFDSAPYDGKYYLYTDLWPLQYNVPAYCNGQCALLNHDAALKIYWETTRTQRHDFRLEDFFYVGILRTKANITDIKAPVYQLNNGKQERFLLTSPLVRKNPIFLFNFWVP